MTDVELPKLVCACIRVLLFAVLVVSETTNSTAKAVQPIRAQTQLPPSNDPETLVYHQWYSVFAARNLKRVIELGESFLKAYPEGKYTGFITRTMDFARISLNPKQRNDAEVLRTQVRGSLKDGLDDLRVLLRGVLNNEAAVDAKSRTGATALMFAATNGDREAVRALIHKDADIDVAENTHRWTALIYALWSGNYLIVGDLLTCYPDADIKDKEGRTALDHAKATADFDMMLLMNGRPR